jgi:tRNA-U20-dihydrouridine synthase
LPQWRALATNPLEPFVVHKAQHSPPRKWWLIQHHLLNTNKSKHRLDFTGEPSPISIQIAGSQADELAYSAQQALTFGADIIDINMGCPAKKVCNKAAGSALMQDEALVKDILTAVVSAVDIPVTFKNAHRLECHQ